MDIHAQLIFLLCCWLSVDNTLALGDTKSEITLSDNAYTGILIAIDEDVAESADTIQKVKDMFTEASAELFKATRQRAHFGDITILVPKTWTGTYDAATSETFDKANIVVHTDASHGNDPRVKVLNTDCGSPGEVMFLTETYVTGNAGGSTDLYSPPGRTITHEWAHLRWGVFDEYPVGTDPVFYLDSAGAIQPVRCSTSLQGAVGTTMRVALDGTVTVVPSDCSIDPATSLPEQWLCFYFPDVDNPGAEASLMGYHFIDDVVHFCDDNNESPTTLHNSEADNTHNRLCNRQSIWEVMKQHADFAEDANPAAAADTDTEPTFQVVQQQPKKVVLVLDVSGSMEGARLERLRQDAASYLQVVVSEGSSVGMVEFSITASILEGLVAITGQADRDTLIAAIPDRTLQSTCIGCGLLEGMAVLGGSCGSIILISDGEENEEPFIEDVIPQLQQACVRVDSLLYSEAAEDKMITLSQQTGGVAYFATDGQTSTDLLNGLLATEAQGNSPVADAAIQVSLEIVDLVDGTPVTLEIPIDESIGLTTVFLFTYVTGDTLDVSLESPDGTTYSITGGECVDDVNLQLIMCEIPDTAETGMWTATLTGTYGAGTDHVSQVLVTSHPATPGTPAITCSGTVSGQDFNAANEFRLRIFAEVTQGYTPITGADVTAIVTSETGVEIEVILLDNGAGCDFTASDGIYSAFFIDISGGDGKYSVEIKVSNENNGANAVQNAPPGSPAFNPELVIAQSEGTAPQLTPLQGPLGRVASAGFFEASGLPADPNTDMFPPAKVMDLRVIGAQASDNTFTLTWTAVGDDLDQGQASSYDLRYCDNITTAETTFSSCTAITNDDVTEGSLTPAIAATRETIKVTLPEVSEETTIYFALKVTDDEGQTSELSNIVSTAVTHRLTFSYGGNNDKLSTILLAGMIAVGGVLVIGLIALVVAIWYTKNHVKKPSRGERYPDAFKPRAGVPPGSGYPSYPGNMYEQYPGQPPYWNGASAAPYESVP